MVTFVDADENTFPNFCYCTHVFNFYFNLCIVSKTKILAQRYCCLSILTLMSLALLTPLVMLKLISTLTSVFLSVSLTMGTYKKTDINYHTISNKNICSLHPSLMQHCEHYLDRYFKVSTSTNVFYQLTEALSSTFILSLSQIPLLRSPFSNVQSGRDSHFPNTTRSISLQGKQRCRKRCAYMGTAQDLGSVP